MKNSRLSDLNDHLFAQIERLSVAELTPEQIDSEHKRGQAIVGVAEQILNGARLQIDHIGRYVDEFAFRLNEGNCARHTLERLDSFVSRVAGKRLTYKTLTA
jgi:hypothetical protein